MSRKELKDPHNFCYNHNVKHIGNVIKRLNKFFDSKVGGVMTLVGSIGVFLALTLSRLTLPSVWFDEGYSMYLMRYDLTDLTHYTAIDVHPPFYYYLLKGWTSLFGDSVAVCRLLSVVLGVVVLILVYLLIKKLFTRKSASLATLLVAISPMFVRYGTETRMYMLVITIAVAATLVFYKLLHSTKKRWAILYGVLICLGMWTHYFTAVIWLSHWVYRYIYLHRHGLHGRQLAKTYFDQNWLLAHGLAIVCYLPWIPVALKQMSGLGGGFWISSLTVNTLSDYLSQFLMYQNSGDIGGWLVVMALGVVVLAAWLGYHVYQRSSGAQRDNLLLIMTIAFAPVALLFILSLPPLTPIFIDRYLLTALVFLAILMGLIIILSRRQPWAVAGLTVLLAVCFGFGIYNVYRLGTYGNFSSGGLAKDLMTQIEADADGSSPIIVGENYSYYEMAAYEQSDNPVHFLLDPIRDDQTGSLQMERDDNFGAGVADLGEYLDEHHQIWLINATDDNGNAKQADDMGLVQAVKSITATNPIHNSTYTATLYWRSE